MGFWVIGTLLFLLVRMMLIVAWNQVAGQQIFPLWDLPGALIGGLLFTLVMFAILTERSQASIEDAFYAIKR